MSALVWRGQHGDEPPPACTGVFDDVPCPSRFADYIEGLYNEGVMVGCGNNNFCPHQPISNGQMAVFLAKAFDIPVLLPPPPLGAAASGNALFASITGAAHAGARFVWAGV